MKFALRFLSASFVICVFSVVRASSEAANSAASKCTILGAASINVFVYCPNELTETELVNAAKSFRTQKTAQDQNGVSVFVFNDPNGPKSTAEMTKMAERRVQKIQVAAYMDYPNGESDYFCKRNGKFQKCKGLLKK